MDAVNCDQKAVADCLSVAGCGSFCSHIVFACTAQPRHASPVLCRRVPAAGPMRSLLLFLHMG